MLFSIIDDKQAIIKNAKTGVFKQVKLYERRGELYAVASGGFIRLMNDQRTSHPNIKWEEIEVVCKPATRVAGGLLYTAPHASH